MVFYFTQSRGTLSGNFLSTLVLEELGYKKKEQYPDINISSEILEQITGNYNVGAETWRLEGDSQRLLFKPGRLVPIEFIPVSNNTYINRYMDMKLEFPHDFNETNEFTFSVQGSSLSVKKTD